MRILLVEDDSMKSDTIVALIRSLPLRDVDIAVESALHPAWVRIKRDAFDLVLLDLTLPLYEARPGELGGRPPGLAGMEILYRMMKKNLHVPTIIVTMFDRFLDRDRELTLSNLREEVRTKYGSFVLDVVYYNTAMDSWKSSLSNLILAKERHEQ